MKKIYEEPMLLQIDLDARIDTVDTSVREDEGGFGDWLPLG